MTTDLLKLPRLLRMGRLTRKLSLLSAARVLRIVALLLGYVLLGHMLCCAFFSLGTYLQAVGGPSNFVVLSCPTVWLFRARDCRRCASYSMVPVHDSEG